MSIRFWLTFGAVDNSFISFFSSTPNALRLDVVVGIVLPDFASTPIALAKFIVLSDIFTPFDISEMNLFNAFPKLPNELDTRGILSPDLARFPIALVIDIIDC